MNRLRWTMVTLSTALLLAWSLGQPNVARAQGATVTVTQAWVRPASKAVGTSAFYAVITNSGGQPDRLESASTPVAGMAQVHETKQGKDGMMVMLHLPHGLKVPAHGSVELKPGAYHVMLMQLKEDIAAGGTVPVTLHFAHAGTIVVQAQVTNAVPAPSMGTMDMGGNAPASGPAKEGMSTGGPAKEGMSTGGPAKEGMSKEQMGH